MKISGKCSKNTPNLQEKKGKGGRSVSPHSSKFATFTKNEIGSLLKDMKNVILYSLTIHMDTMKIKKRQKNI
jgi:hypothetical protein